MRCGHFLLVLNLFVVSSCSTLHWQKEQIAPGLEWRQSHTAKLYDSQQNINILRVNTRLRQLDFSYVTDTFLPTSQLASRHAEARAAINAGFFKIREGKGSATYLRVKGQTIDDLPSPGNGQLNGALILHREGLPDVEYAQPNAAYNERPADETILVTGPVLLLHGKTQPLKIPSDFVEMRHPRTCLCITKSSDVLLVTVDGRHKEAAGMTLPELTGLLKKLRCRSAINLDGGGSTTLWIKGKPENGVVNCPSDNKVFDHKGERPCANAIVVK